MLHHEMIQNNNEKNILEINIVVREKTMDGSNKIIFIDEARIGGLEII